MDNFGYVIATKMLVENERKVRFMYREAPSNEQDSGWRFFCGDEGRDYVDDPDNMAIYNVNTILAIDNSIKRYLKSAIGTALEREDENSFFSFSENLWSSEDGD